MTINKFEFSYEKIVSPDWHGLIPIHNDYLSVDGKFARIKMDYVEKTLNYIRENGGVPDFVLPRYYRFNVVYTCLDFPENYNIPENAFSLFQENTISVISDPDGGNIPNLYNKVQHNQKKSIRVYEYKNDISGNSPISNFTLLRDEKWESWKNDWRWKDNQYIYATTSFLSHNDESLESLTTRRFRVDVTLTYSDDNPSAGDEYVEPKKLKQYLVNLDFGGRKFLRNKSNRRKYRNRY